MSRFTPASQRGPGPHGAVGSPRSGDNPNWRPAEPVTWVEQAVVIGGCVAVVAAVALALGYYVHPALGAAVAGVVAVRALDGLAWRRL